MAAALARRVPAVTTPEAELLHSSCVAQLRASPGRRVPAVTALEGELPSGSATAAPAAAQAAVQSTASTSGHALRGVAAAQQQRQPTPAATPGSAAPRPRPTQGEQPLARPPWEVAHILWQVSNTPHATQMHVPHASVDRLRGPHRPRGPKGVRQAQYRCVESQAWPYGPPAAWLATPSPYHTPSKSASAPSLSLRPSSVNTSRLYGS